MTRRAPGTNVSPLFQAHEEPGQNNPPNTPSETPIRQPPPKTNEEFNVKYVHVLIGTMGKDGEVHETVHSVNGDDVMITAFKQHSEDKVKPCKDDDGRVIGFEPTGECQMSMTVKFIRNP